MAYKALYRSYRPRKFDEVIGQKHVIQTLKNAIKENRCSHAYVFSGLRGIGKTTIARILSKAVNCLSPINGEPCLECGNCKAIDNNETTDIIELDAASNNGVDEMRSILDRVNFLPSSLKNKVYIIDEVHMLSTSAFNALLKTLEEPPAYVMFILATTEPHKIPLTILSRCQRFDFKQLTINELKEQLSIVARNEHLTINDDALDGIAEAAEGGMRDALGILDQASVYADEVITIDDVNSITGRISVSKMIELIKALNESNATKATIVVNDLLNMGKEVSRLSVSIIQFCRDLLLFKTVDNIEMEKSIFKNKDFIELASETDSKALFYYIDNFVDIQNKIRYTNSQKIYLEVGIMKIVTCASNDLDIMNRISKIEESLANGSSFEFSSTPSTLSDQRLNVVENKIKKLQNDFDKVNINRFIEQTNSKLAILEDETSKISILPTTIETRLQVVENVLGDNSYSNIEHDNVSINNDDVNDLVKHINDLDCKIDSIESTTKNLESQTQSLFNKSNDDILNDLILKISDIELKLEPNATTSEYIEKNDSDISNRINKIESSIVELKDAINDINDGNSDTFEDNNISIYNNEETSYSNESLDDISNMINSLKEQVSSLVNDVNNLKNISNYNKYNNSDYDLIHNEIKELKNNISNIIQTIECSNVIESKQTNLQDVQHEHNIIDSSNNCDFDYFNQGELTFNFDEINERLSSVTSKFEEFSNSYNELLSKNDNNVVEIKEVKSSIFVINEAIKYLTDKLDGLSNKMQGIEKIKISHIEPQIDEINENILKMQKELNDVSSNVKANELSLQEAIEKYDSKLCNISSVSEQNHIASRDSIESDESVTSNNDTNLDNNDLSNEQTNNNTIKETSEDVQEQVLEEPKHIDLTQEVYDIKIVENILHESRMLECREEKKLLIQNWAKIEDKVGGLLAHLARVLSEGLLVANGSTHLLIVYKTAQQCNYMMETKNHKDAIEILKVTFNKDYDFIALPDNTWKEKRLEYHNRYNTGEKFPKLTPINNPELKVIEINANAPLTERQMILKKADDFFGKDD